MYASAYFQFGRELQLNFSRIYGLKRIKAWTANTILFLHSLIKADFDQTNHNT